MQEKRQKKNIGEIIDKKYFTKEELQTHDRELVKEVCEKIKEKAFGLWYFVLTEQKEHFEGNRYVLSQKDFNDILDQIQKEFEK